jgi:putative SOS response-associated peptidase YedK
MKWIHHRMPLFLSKSDDVDLWLDPKISSYDAIDIINKRQNDEEVNFLAIIRNSLL